MKPHVFLLFLFLVLSSCYNRFSCGPAQNKNLGTISFSKMFQDWNLAQQTDSLVFVSKTDTVTLIKNDYNTQKHKQAKVYNVCQSIDIKPYTAYAYYEYPNQEHMFQDDAVVLHIDPVISYHEDTKQESLYLNLAHGNNSIKAAIPANHGTLKGPPFNTHNTRFILQKTLSLDDKKFSNIWVCEANGLAMYYHSHKGIIAFSINNTMYYKH